MLVRDGADAGSDASAGTCASGLSCSNGECVNAGAAGHQSNPNAHCFMPCLSSFTSDAGVTTACDPSTHLLDIAPGAACPLAQTCTSGACQGPAGPTACSNDGQCPGFQACIQGFCASECYVESDCDYDTNATCANYVCRDACDNDMLKCGPGYTCIIDSDGQGLCQPQPPDPDAGTTITGLGSYDVAPTSQTLRLDPNHLVQKFTIFNRGTTQDTFTITKVRQTDYATSTTVTFDPNADAGVAQHPLSWLLIGPVGASQKVDRYTVTIAGGASADVEVNDAPPNGPGVSAHWQGTLQVSADRYDTKTISLTYSADASGHWVGDVYYFESFGDDGLDAWRTVLATPSAPKPDPLSVKNALMQKWIRYRNGNAPLRSLALSFHEVEDVVTSVTTGSWLFPNVAAGCGGGNCYPSDAFNIPTSGPSVGLGHFDGTDDTASPIPRGAVKMTMGMDLTQTNNGTSFVLAGTINSDDALQYAGSPTITIGLAGDPNACVPEDPFLPAKEDVCHQWMTSLSATAVTGARYISNPADTDCHLRLNLDGSAGGPGLDLKQAQIPWLLPGFRKGTTYDPTSDLSYTYECRDKNQPYATGSAVNPSLAGANPIPDGRPRQRTLELVDGMLFSVDQMVILFREKFDSGFLGNVGGPATGGAPDAHLVKYGIMLLRRSPHPPVTPPATQQAPETRTQSVPLQDQAVCQPFIDKVFPGAGLNPSSLTNAQWDQLFAAIADGTPTAGNPMPYANQLTDPTTAPYGSTGQVHYLCKTSNTFDTAAVCASGDITYFAFINPADPNNNVTDRVSNKPVPLGQHLCNTSRGTDGQQGSCDGILKGWESAGGIVDMNPIAQCALPAGASAPPVTCDNVANMLWGKTFYPSSAPPSAPGQGTELFTKIETAVAEAFRYKTQFQNRSGTTVGFAPTICIQDSSAVPYCYDAAGIEVLRDRLSCIASLYTSHFAALSSVATAPAIAHLARADALMKQTFSFNQRQDPTNPNNKINDYGFEFLNAELMIMLGDDAYTKAFESRFDLAGSESTAFQGDLFEPNGVALGGAAGFEFYTLYQAAQYYQTVLDRFFSLSPYIWTAIQYGNAGNTERDFASHDPRYDMVSTYIPKLVRASTQKAAAWNEVAKRYQRLNRPDLARLVVGRAYTATYIESILLNRLLTMMGRDAGINLVLDQTKRSYEASLLDMNDVYNQITDQISYFGFAPDYVPFPITDDTGNQTAFDVVMAAAASATADAQSKEDLAIAQDHSFNGDATAFQAQLTQIRSQYEDQLAQICGTFQASDGTVYPAIKKYAADGNIAPNPNNPNAPARSLSVLGDPCGLVGNGGISDAIDQLQMAQVDAQKLQVQNSNLQAQINIEIARYNAQCKAQTSAAQITMNTQFGANGMPGTVSLQDDINDNGRDLEKLSRDLSIVGTLSGLTACTIGTSSDCPSKLIADAAFGIAAGAIASSQDSDLNQQQTDQAQIDELQKGQAQWNLDHACDLAQIDSNAKISTLALGFRELSLEAVKQSEAVHQSIANLNGLHNQALRLEAQQLDAEQLAISAAAAKNDPNVRIYKNDAVINADASFELALQAAYKATLVYQYYTSQSYAHLVDLSLVRLVSHGDYNLANYLRDLQAAYATFQENYGKPDVRVISVSLCDDILAIPYYGPDSKIISTDDRRTMCENELLGPQHLDAQGYITIPFSTTSDALSPITRDHKILYIEADLDGTKQGVNDLSSVSPVFVPRIYLRQKGTATVLGLDGSRTPYRFPERTAVIGMTYEGSMSGVDPTVFRSDRFKDRPFLNNGWEFVLNLRDEPANVYLKPQFISDIRVFIYYTDFTAL
jgi:hypothetical protein